MIDQAVTFVVATYNRPDTLLIALKSVQQQSEGGWKVLVVGDACTSDTALAVEGLADPRIQYINLAERFGHQSGPNSVGSMLASSSLLAFLNHDDILLPDHLTRARSALRKGSDFFVGSALFAETKTREAIESAVPLFIERSRSDMSPADAFNPGANLFEPASAWVFNRHLMERVGIWVHPRQTFRSPLQDFIMRVWRARARFSFGNIPTVLKIVTFRTTDTGGTYSVPSSQHESLAQLLEGKSADEQREIALAAAGAPREVQRMRRRPNPLSSLGDILIFSAGARALYLRTGIDSVAVYGRAFRRKPGRAYGEMVTQRTKLSLPDAHGYEAQVEEAARQFGYRGRAVVKDV